MNRNFRCAFSHGSLVCALVWTALAQVSAAVTIEQSQLYWTDLNSDLVSRSNLDGSGRQTLFNVGVPTYLVASPTLGKMYFSVGYQIFSADLNGGSRQLLGSFGDANYVRGLAVDAVGQKIYWTSSHGYSAGNGKVRSMNLDGSNPVDLAVLTERYPYGMALDGAGHLYWLDTVDEQRIERMNADGTGRTTLVTSHVGFNGQIAVGPDKMFWLNSESRHLFSADLDGGNVQVVSSLGGTAYDGGISVDPIARRVFWGDSSLHSILMANFDGTDKATVYSAEYLYPMGISVASVPEPATLMLAVVGALAWSVIRRLRVARM